MGESSQSIDPELTEELFLLGLGQRGKDLSR
jgi:hypothetical protein